MHEVQLLALHAQDSPTQVVSDEEVYMSDPGVRLVNI